MASEPGIRNRILLNTVFGFKNGSPLKGFVQERSHRADEYFTLAEILETLKEAISAGGWFDRNNPAIILCPPELEAVLDQKAVHVAQVKDLVLSQLIPKEYQRNKATSTDTTTTVTAATKLTGPPPASSYELKPPLLGVFRTMDEIDQTKTRFTYEEVTTIFSKYILKHKDRLFDRRNIQVALVENDPLGAALHVRAFHRSQVHTLLRTQLTPTPTLTYVSHGHHNLDVTTTLLQNLDIQDSEESTLIGN